ncbi:MAG: tRNA uridine(34) 5-carboxymethylaminomethyl modification radical SAM/GNAT enzyme Elp3, partial [Candidatus Nanoarchaeia archaeon]|nr:tRNA uridine(34) 5-carboxymethylaminomethyl modification radical SAM/GNAT enzyme Elp3 [Candidatus Nanoarchaeia archaeon]
TYISNTEIIQNYDGNLKPVLKILRIKPARMLSGVSVVAVMTKPSECIHGKCIMCPGGVCENLPKSYLLDEPALMRAKRLDYHPYKQTNNRLRQYIIGGHTPEKVELIVMGGTFLGVEKNYQKFFIRECFHALNDFPEKITKSSTLEKEKKKNEKAKARCVALVIETRPDLCYEPHINSMLDYGATRVEIGVQSTYNDVLDRIKRGHTIRDVIKSTQLLKDSGFKVTYHMMPGLPGSTAEKDIEMFRELFSNPDFCPDGLKIYPTLVIKGTELYKMWKNKQYKALNDETAVKIISEAKKFIPEYVRIMRVQRDVPVNQIVAGPKSSNLRQLVLDRTGCRCIRCREIKADVPADVKLLRKDYNASMGKEIFLSAEDIKNDKIIGICRLRIPYKPFRKEINDKSALIRELHIYGKQTAIGEKGKSQHKGWGRKLLKEAEKIAKSEFNKDNIVVISGVGVREYYRKFGYKLKGAYMVKRI